MTSVICELLLCMASIWAGAVSLKDRQGWRTAGFLLIATTALLGALVYARLEQFQPVHQFMSGVSARLALLLIAVGGLYRMSHRLLLVAAAAVMLWVPEQWALAGNVIALIAIAWPGRSRRWPLALMGALLFMFAGLVVGVRGDWHGIARQDIYHLTLMLAALSWGMARLVSQGPQSRLPAPLAD
ncbi:hypothetical protein NTD84_08800 [Pseudomonas sp. 14P_8.1_Bac3]|uniref:hypothetical protein n=1 Tax=Pseudomonas sp. 14P_8.1_Bac3 TaxID=2971621 RepID=UPI0021CA7420|nr:hypothetical protein [Pseudomonas sp. 14P_8.1_Bac3]MCU1759817.1 hypothetical protein [Pseudomonas sp. 14P_8.1_Bac3]